MLSLFPLKLQFVHKIQVIFFALFLWSFLSITVPICFVYLEKILLYFAFLSKNEKSLNKKRF